MQNPVRFVADTNILISQLLFPKSTPAIAFQKALGLGTPLASDETLTELTEVLARPKFDPYLTIEERLSFLKQLSPLVEFIHNITQIRMCRDPKDDKFLSLAKSGDAQFILTGDSDLLELDPFGSIRILTTANFLLMQK